MKYFTIEELCKSTTATKKGIKNIPNETEKKSLIALVDNILDPLRTKWGKPIVINSGFRCDKLNKAVGGSSTSQHRYGEAADIEDSSRTLEQNKKLFNLILEMKLPFDQLIYEFGSDSGPDWIHISFGKRSRRQILRAKKVNGKTIYNTYKP